MGLVLYNDAGDALARQTRVLFDADTADGHGPRCFSPGITTNITTGITAVDSRRLAPRKPRSPRSPRSPRTRMSAPPPVDMPSNNNYTRRSSRRCSPTCPPVPSLTRQDAFCADRAPASEEQQLRRLGVYVEALGQEDFLCLSSQSENSSQSQSSQYSWTATQNTASSIDGASQLDHRNTKHTDKHPDWTP